MERVGSKFTLQGRKAHVELRTLKATKPLRQHPTLVIVIVMVVVIAIVMVIVMVIVIVLVTLETETLCLEPYILNVSFLRTWV